MFAQTTLGIQMEDAKNPDNKFATAFRQMMGENDELNILHSLARKCSPSKNIHEIYQKTQK